MIVSVLQKIKYTLHDRELEDLFDEALSKAEDLLNRKGTCKLFSAVLALENVTLIKLTACYKGRHEVLI